MPPDNGTCMPGLTGFVLGEPADRELGGLSRRARCSAREASLQRFGPGGLTATSRAVTFISTPRGE